jgi:hypothetical protein
MLLGRRDKSQRQLPLQIIIVPNQGQDDCAALLDGGSRKPLGDAIMVGLVRALLANLQLRPAVSLMKLESWWNSSGIPKKSKRIFRSMALILQQPRQCLASNSRPVLKILYDLCRRALPEPLSAPRSRV